MKRFGDLKRERQGCSLTTEVSEPGGQSVEGKISTWENKTEASHPPEGRADLLEGRC